MHFASIGARVTALAAVVAGFTAIVLGTVVVLQDRAEMAEATERRSAAVAGRLESALAAEGQQLALTAVSLAAPCRR